MAKVHRRIQDRRKAFIEKLTTRLARNFDVIVVEDLSGKNMHKNGNGGRVRSARPLSQTGWNQVVRGFPDKGGWYGARPSSLTSGSPPVRSARMRTRRREKGPRRAELEMWRVRHSS